MILSQNTSSSSSSSITDLVASLCDRCLSGVSWKRRALGGISRENFHRTLKKRAYGSLLSTLFQDRSKVTSAPNPANPTPPRNKLLMICFDLRVAGCREEAERLEELLEKLPQGEDSGLTEVDSVIELLVRLAGSSPPPAATFSQNYMRRERAVVREPQPWSYQSEELQRLEARAWGLICAEEWGTLETLWGTQSLMDAPPGSGLLALRSRTQTEEKFEKESRLSLFGALQHTRSSDMELRLEVPPVPSNIDVTGLAIKVPLSLDPSEDEGFQSSSNMTPDSQSESSPVPELDVWEALLTFEPGRRRCWESVGCPPGNREALFVTESGREAFDQLYRLWEGGVRLVSETPSSLLPLVPLPQDTQPQLVTDLLNVLIGVASTTFPLNQSQDFTVRSGVCVSGASTESVSRLLQELAQYGTHYLRLSDFSLQKTDKKGLVFQAFTGGLRKYLHYYRACVLSTPPTLSLLTIGFLFRKVGHQLRYLSELCCVDGALGERQNTFPVGVKLLSYLYNEAQNNCSNENYPVLLSLLKRSCAPYTRFVSDWVYSGVFRDVYGEFMIQVNEEHLGFRDKNYWVQGYTLISKDVEDCVPIFLRHIANDVYVCGKTINLLKICCPQHYICCSELPVPRIAVTFSLQEVEQIERDCAVYRGRMQRIAKHSAISREEQTLRTERARQELINQVRETAAKTLEKIRGRQVSQRLAEEAKKRERFEELKQHLEQEQEWRTAARKRQEEDDFSFARELRDREKRLQALEEQLEQQARKELIAQYCRLSEEAALRERKALWRVQRNKLHLQRTTFLTKDQQQIQEVLEKYPLGKARPPVELFPSFSAPTAATEKPPMEEQHDQDETHEPSSSKQTETQPPPDHTPPPIDPNPISEHIDLNKFLPKPPNPGMAPVDSALQDIGSDLPQTCPTLPLVDYDFSAPFSPLEGLTQVSPKPRLAPGVEAGLNSHIKFEENVSDFVASLPSPNVHGHSSDSNFKIGELVPNVYAPLPSPNIHGHSTDSHIKIGENVSDFAAPFPTPNLHGHSSDANIKVGEFVSNVTLAIPRPSQHGHASDSALLSGCTMSGSEPVLTPLPGSSFGHSSDSALGLCCVVAGVDPKRTPIPGSSHGHSSDSSLVTGCVVSQQESTQSPLPGGGFGHSSDSALRMGCVVTGVEPKKSPLPGSEFGHSSDSSLGVGCVVSASEPVQATPVLTSAFGHSSDSSLRVGCVVKSKDGGDPHATKDMEVSLSGCGAEQVAGAGAAGALSPGEVSEQLYLSALSSHYQVEQYQDSYSTMGLWTCHLSLFVLSD
uniref:Gamma-tubulin complex component 6 n=1 Tax=Knipowitschia caucasica TaxID=637954 RepID=A0AAV2KWD8_KNICA